MKGSRLQGRIPMRDIFFWAMPVWAVLASFLLGSLVILAAGKDPALAYTALIKGAVGNVGLAATTLVKSIPLMLAGLAIVLAFRASVFNIGAEGQIYMGALMAVLVGVYLPLPAGLHAAATLAAGMIGGLAWAAIAGYLKATRGFNEVVVTIFMNYIAISFVSYLVHGPLKEPGWNFQTLPVADTAKLPRILARTPLHAGLIIALIAAAFVYVLLFHTTLGYRMRMVGLNADAARYSGIRVTRITVLSMALSGMLAGLAGAIEISGVQYRLIDGFSPGWGFDAIAVALVGQLHPAGVLVSALFFGALRTGANSMQTAIGLPVVVVYVIQGLTVLFMIAGTAVQHYSIRRVTQAPAEAENARDLTAVAVVK